MLHYITLKRLARTLGRTLRRVPRRARTRRAGISHAELRRMPAEAWRAKLLGDPAEAARWIEAAAHHGFVEAQVSLGQMLLDGIGVARDPAAALRWFRHAAAAGSAAAVNMVGRCHDRGWGTAQDHAAAAAWYRRAADQDLDWARYNLANLLLRGRGVPRDRIAAFALFRRAADQGHAKSMNLVGRFLEEGWEIPANPAEAAVWYRRSAEAGDDRGQYNHATALAAMGRVPEALPWFRAAIDGATPDLLLLAAGTLSARAEPALRDLGRRAAARHAELLAHGAIET